MNRIAALLLAVLGLATFAWAGLTSGDLSVARLTIIDPLVVAAICLAIAFAAEKHARAALRGAHRLMMGIPEPAYVSLAALTIIVGAVVVSRIAFGGQPAMTDELSQAFQGRVLQTGHVAAAGERYREFFESAQTVRTLDKWYSEYPIGSGLLAMLGDVTHMAWLLNPVIMALGAIAIYFFAKRSYEPTTARITLALLTLSPFIMLMTATRMNHVPALALTGAALFALAVWADADNERNRMWAGAAIGGSIGFMFLIRPYDAALIGIPIAVFQLSVVIPSGARDLHVQFPRSARNDMGSIALQLLVALTFAVIQLRVNLVTTTRWFLFGYDALNGGAHRPGFHMNPLGMPFTPSDGVNLVVLYLQRLNTALFESAIPALAFVAGGLWLTRTLSRWDKLLLGIMVTVLAGYGIYWFDGNFFGPRFLFPALIAFIVFAARFVVIAGERSSQSRAALAAALMLPVCLVLAVLPAKWGNRSTGTWMRFSQLGRSASLGIDPAADARLAGLKNALVFVHEPLHSRITARLRALGMSPFDAERTVADLDACALLTALAKSDARPDVPPSDRLKAVFTEAAATDPTRPIAGLYGAAALSLSRGAPSSEACRAEIERDRSGVEPFERFLAVATFDDSGRLGGDVIYARSLGARDSILRTDPRFANRTWLLYQREQGTTKGRFEPYRDKSGGTTWDRTMTDKRNTRPLRSRASSKAGDGYWLSAICSASH